MIESDVVEWDQGVVHFITTDHKGRETHGSANCWHRANFIAGRQAEALVSQMDKDEAKRFKFRVVVAGAGRQAK